MKRRRMLLVQVLFFFLVAFFACTKDRSVKLSSTEAELEIGSLRPDPIPVDTLLLDTLDRPGYQ